MNNPPVVVNQSYSIKEDTVLSVPAASGLLRGSSDVDGDVIVVVNTTKPANGNLTVQTDGAFVYAPNPNYNGPESFWYTATDGQGAFVKAMVIINIGGLGCV